MANYYIRHGAYGTYAATPSGSGWPLNCQDGDGQGTGIAVTSSVEIDLSAWTAGTSATITVLGVPISITNGQSGQTMAAAIATSISASTTAITFQPTNWSTPQLRNAVYATTDGAGKLRIMTRAGSAAYNGQVITQANLTGGTWGTPSFSGGVSGAWGYITNDSATIWPSAVPVWSYGVCYNSTANYYIAGPTPTASDVIYIKSATTAGGGIALTSITNNTTDFKTTYNANLVIDDGTVWTTDVQVTASGTLSSGSATVTISPTGIVAGMQVSGTGIPFDTQVSSVGTTTITLSRNATVSGSQSLTFTPAVTFQNTNSVGYAFQVFAASSNRFYIGTKTVGRLIFRLYHGTGGPAAGFGGGTAGNNWLTIENAVYIDASTSNQGQTGFTFAGAQSSNNNVWQFLGGQFYVLMNRQYPIVGNTTAGGYGGYDVLMEGITFQFPAFTGTPTGLVYTQMLANSHRFIFRNCRNLTTSIASTLNVFTGTPTTMNAAAVGIAENNQGFAVNNNIGILGLNTNVSGATDQGVIVQQNVGATRQSRIETNSYVRDWQPGANFPTLTATLPDGTLWCYRVLWAGPSLPGAVHSFSNLELLKLAKTSVSSGYQTVTLEFYVPSGIASSITNYHIQAVVTYVSATDSLQKVEYSTTGSSNSGYYNRLSATALASSSAAWTANGFSGYTPVKISWTLAQPILANTEVMASIRLLQNAPSANQTFFIHPDIGLS